MQEAKIKAAYDLAANETIPPMAIGHHGDWWFRKGVAAAQATLAAGHLADVARATAELAAEVSRLKDLIQKAKTESELIEYKGKASLVVPYWFLRASIETAERVPYAWEVCQGGRTYLISAQEFTGKSFDCASFTPLFL